MMSRRRMMQSVGASMALASSAGAAQEPKEDDRLPIRAHYYQHFGADHTLDVPEQGFGGWETETLDFSRTHTAVVCMHAWAAGQSPEDFPGWWRSVPYIPRSNKIMRTVFPPLLEAVRASSLPLFHVVGGGDYYKELPGYKHAAALAGEAPPAPDKVASDPLRDKLNRFRSENVFVGAQNKEDVNRGFKVLDFGEEARPKDGEGIAENGQQLFALCKEKGINHLIYCGFAINWCLLLSPGGMAEMQKYGLMCSALRQATTAVESKESAPKEWAKAIGLWRVALAYGFVFNVDDFMGACKVATKKK
jgi:hypothetical protein